MAAASLGPGLHGLLSYSPVFDAPQAVDTLTTGTPCVPTPTAPPSRAGRVKGEEQSVP
jgi:hypothetical protein